MRLYKIERVNKARYGQFIEAVVVASSEHVAILMHPLDGSILGQPQVTFAMNGWWQKLGPKGECINVEHDPRFDQWVDPSKVIAIDLGEASSSFKAPDVVSARYQTEIV